MSAHALRCLVRTCIQIFLGHLPNYRRTPLEEWPNAVDYHFCRLHYTLDLGIIGNVKAKCRDIRGKRKFFAEKLELLKRTTTYPERE